MKLYTLFLLIFSTVVFSQENKYWYAFNVEDTITNPLSSSLGFKDSKGNIKIKPIYISLFTKNKKFEKIIALTEYSKNKARNYYMNKKGMKFGIDSLYTFDFTHDTEQEGYIRFSVGHYLDSIGLFNEYGKVVIEPKYNSLSKVNNGLLIAKIGAKQEHENHNSGCDHWRFVGGKEMIIDTLGNVLIDNFIDNDLFLNLYSLKITEYESKEKYRYVFKGNNNKYYSFISNKEEFEDFIKTDFLKNIKKETLEKYLFGNLKKVYNYDKNGRRKKEILDILRRNTISIFDYSFFNIDLENTENLKSMEKYLDNTNELNWHKYPTFEIKGTDKLKKKEVYLSFIRTEEGYKVYDYRSLKIRNDVIKFEE